MYGDSRTMFADSSSVFDSNSKPKEREEVAEDIIVGRRVMDSDTNTFGECTQNNHADSGLLRFLSAPSSLLCSFSDGIEMGCGDSGSEVQRFASRFNSWGGDGNLIGQSFQALDEEEKNKGMVNGYSLNCHLPPQYPRQRSTSRAVRSMAMDHQVQMKVGSGLARQNSSPAGLFSHLAAQTGYGTMRGIGNYRMGTRCNNGDLTPSSSSSRVKRQMNLSTGVLPPSSLGMLSRISEAESENYEVSSTTSADDGKLGSCDAGTHYYSSAYPFGTWNDSSTFAENFTGLKMRRDADCDEKLLFSCTQNGESGSRVPIISHHLSLPKTSAEMGALEKLLQFQDSVPCKIRAKRGFATHPRSIAERVRRTRISERMRKLQEVVPNMEKQTNTADMLDLAVEYIKDLQNQYKTLSDIRANCKCSGMQKAVANQLV